MVEAEETYRSLSAKSSIAIRFGVLLASLRQKASVPEAFRLS